jgi:hypothetical protein
MGMGWEGVDYGGRIFLFVILGLDPRVHAQASDISGLGGWAGAEKMIESRRAWVWILGSSPRMTKGWGGG